MFIIALIVVAILMFKLGMLTVIAGMLSFGLKAVIFVITILVSIFVWRWIRQRRSQP